MKYHPGDIITDERNNSVEILEIRGSHYCGRKIGFLNDEAAWHSRAVDVDRMHLKVTTRAERLELARQRLARFNLEDQDAEHIQRHISYLESLA